MSRLAPAAALALVAAAGAAPRAAAAQARVVVTGRVVGPDSQPVARAVVVVGSAAANPVPAAPAPAAAPAAPGGPGVLGAPAPRPVPVVGDSVRTDATGAFAVAVPRAPSYVVGVAALGFQPLRRTVPGSAAAGGAAERVAVGEVRLARAVAVLSNVTARADRVRRPSINSNDFGNDAGSSPQWTNGGAVAPVDAGNLAAMAASIPGVTLTPGANGGPPGFSVLGLGAAQNNVTLNGLSFGGAQLPSTAQAFTRLQTTSFDPSVGGFSGGLLSTTLFRGSNYKYGSLGVTLDDPALQFTDPAGARLGQQYRNLQGSASRSGPVVRDKLFYNVAVQAGQRSNDLTTLANADGAALAAVGVSRAAGDRLYATLDTLGAPAPRAAAAQTRTRSGSLLARVDILPTQRRTLNLTVNGGWSRTGPSLLAPLALPSHGGRTESRSGGAQLEHAHYVADRFLSRTRTGASLTRNATDALAALPDGRVLVGSVLPDGSAGLATLQFGGSSAAGQRARGWTWETTHETSWYLGKKHQPKVAAGAKLDGYTNDAATNAFGTYSYNSLDDLAAGRPAAFTRTLGGWRTAGRAANAWASLGDVWRPTDRLSLQGGVRVEGNRYGLRPAYNPAVDSAFGVRTDQAPSGVAVSPRLGFSWGYGKTKAKVGGWGGSGPRGTIRGGVGQFRGLLPTSLLAPAVNGTGLPSALQRVTCVGPAVPAPDWRAYENDPAAIPTACAVEAGAGTAFADARPPVTLFLPNYDATRAWRGTLGWGAPLPRLSLYANVDATYSRNLDQPGSRDLNFAGRPGFTLADEGGRPVFVDPARVDPASGATDPAAARTTARFGRVTALGSDLRSESRQLSLRVTPAGLRFSNFWSLGYAYTRVRDQLRGFDGAAFGDPRLAPWGTGAGDVRHALTGSFSRPLGDRVHLSLSGQLRSGTPFTPAVTGDVNGDGLAFNDRAFVFDPAAAAAAGDTALARGMRDLLGTAPPAARACLTRQHGGAAARNSCRGPWTASLFASVNVQGEALRLPPRSRLSFTLSNPLAGVDQLLHGERGLRGWGQPAQPDPPLLTVRGFDAGARRFRYAVNPAFGSTRPARSALRAPFTITLNVSLPITPPQSRQLLEEVLEPGRSWKGPRLTAAQIKQRYQSAGFFLNPVRAVASAKDSLLLTAPQLARVAAVGRAYDAALDSAWTGLSADLAALPARYDRPAMLARVRDAQNRAWDALDRAARELAALLTRDQQELLAPEVRSMLDPETLRKSRRAEVRVFF